MLKLSVSIAALMLCAASNANAATDGHWLRKECYRSLYNWSEKDIKEKNKDALSKGWSNNFERAQCRAYIFGVVDGLSLAGGVYNVGWCLPENEDIKGDQTYRIVYEYVEKNPKDWGKSAALLIALAIREAWPCKSKQTFERVQ